MGIAIPQVVTEDRASGALVVDGSLKFDRVSDTINTYLERTFTDGNPKKWTWSAWIKRDNLSSTNRLFGGNNNTSDNANWTTILFHPTSNDLRIGAYSAFPRQGNASFRDSNGWYNLVVNVDIDSSDTNSKYRAYINNEELTWSSTNDQTNTGLNRAGFVGYIGTEVSGVGGGQGNGFGGSMSQCYFTDGLSLGPGYFGYTDPLTGTWRPKKFRAEGTTVNDGTVWSAGAGANFDSSNPATNGFDGNPATYARTDNANVTATVTFSKPIHFANLAVRGALETGGIIKVNGVDVSSQYASGSSTLQTINLTQVAGVSSPLTSISLTGVSGAAQPRFSQIIVDGVAMQDSTTTNLDFGTNGYYLPMDGNSPIGEDQSGKGNDWTPKGFGGSVALPKATGAKPILNTGTGGTVARPGVFGSEENQIIEVTVSNTSGNNRYYFDGSLTPDLAFTRGSTITFHTTNNGNVSGDSHPFKLSSTNASGSAGTEYTDGVAYYINGSVVSGSDYVSNYSGGAASGFRGIKWTVPHNQSTTYYYCTAHTGMGNNGALTSTTDETKADPYAWKCVLALPLVGSDDDVSNSVNSGSTTKAITTSGALASSAVSNFYNGSFLFDGTDDYIAVTDNADLAFGDGDSTVELWVYPNTLVSNDVLYDSRQSTGGTTTGFSIVVNSSGQVQTYTAGDYRCSATSLLYEGKWSHIAVVRSSGTDTLFIDGIAQADTNTNNGDYTDQKCRIGSDVNGSEAWGGYISDFRLYKGVAKYTSNFIPASTNPDILPDTPSGVSGSSKLAKVTDGAVAFDGASDNLSVPDHADLDFGTSAFTIECFLYMNSYGSSGSYPSFISKYTNSLSWILRARNTGKLIWYSSTGGGTNNESTTNPMTLKKWLHIAAVREGTGSNQMKVYVDGKLHLTVTDANDYNDSNDLCIGSQNTGNTNVIDGYVSNVRVIKGTALYTTDFTPPTRELTNVTNTKLLCCQSNSLSGGYAVCPTPGGINDGTIWSSLVSAPDGTSRPVTNLFNGDTADSANGSLIPTEGSTWTLTHNFGSVSTLKFYTYYPSGSTSNGANAFQVNGVTVTPSSKTNSGYTVLPIAGGTLTSFGSKYTGSGDYCFVSAIEVDGTVLLDPIKVNGDTSATNFNPFNTDINTVRGQESGYATFNSLNPNTYSSYYTLSDGNLKCTAVGGTTKSSGARGYCASSIGMTSTGKYYFECHMDNLQNTDHGVGIVAASATGIYSSGGENYIYRGGGGKVDNAATSGTYGDAFTTGDTIGISFDVDSGELIGYKNGVSQGTIATVTTNKTYYFIWAMDAGSAQNYTVTANFGQKPYKFPPPDGFQSLNATSVRPETVIARPDQYVSATIYTGNQSVRTISTGNTPDLVWIKDRTQDGHNHNLIDTVRGAPRILQSDSVVSEITDSTDGLTSFTSNGFTLAANVLGNQSYELNKTGNNYVAWCWKAGGNKNTFNVDDVGYASAAAAGLDGGTLSPTGASVGTKQGFSIIKYTGEGAARTINHGMNKVPRFMLVKRTDDNASWAVYHAEGGNTKVYELNGTGTGSSSSTAWNSTTPTSSLFSIGDYADTGIAADYIAYIWADVPGLQKFGKWTNNNSNDGTFTELGFRPEILLLKDIDGGEQWYIIDSKRQTFNIPAPSSNGAAAVRTLQPSSSNNETTADDAHTNATVDFLSNGFKIYTTNPASGEISYGTRNYIYAAWAAAPAFNLYGAQSNAR